MEKVNLTGNTKNWGMRYNRTTNNKMSRNCEEKQIANKAAVPLPRPSEENEEDGERLFPILGSIQLVFLLVTKNNYLENKENHKIK